MNKKFVGIFVFMLLIFSFLPASGLNINNEKTSNECDCINQLKDIDEKYFDKYPTMEKSPSFIDIPESGIPEIIDTPSSFSWLDFENSNWLTPVKKQLCGDCWDYAALGTLESIIKIRENCPELTPDLSEQYVLSCLPNAGSCHGGNSYHAFQLMMETTEEGNYHNGIIPESCFPYQASDDIPCEDKCSDWEEKLIPILDYGQWRPDGSSSSREEIKTYVMENGPVATHIESTDYFAYWGSTHHSPNDYFPYTGPSQWVNHVVMLLGWEDSSSIGKGGYWICKNSWGNEWGYDGFFNIEYGSLSIDTASIVWVDYDPESVDWDPIADAGGYYNAGIGEEITFDGTDSFDIEGEISAYTWEFGDKAVKNGATATHIYLEKGIYEVTLTVTDSNDNTDTDKTWVWIDEPSNSPNTPVITGPERGSPNQEYTYSISTTDANGDDVYYLIDWGEYQNTEEWVGPYTSGEELTFYKSWSALGDYEIKVKAKDNYGLESDWGTLSVSMPKNRMQNNLHLFKILDILLNALPILRNLLRL